MIDSLDVAIFADESCLGNQFQGRANPGVTREKFFKPNAPPGSCTRGSPWPLISYQIRFSPSSANGISTPCFFHQIAQVLWDERSLSAHPSLVN